MSEVQNDVNNILETGEVELKTRIFAYLIDAAIFFKILNIKPTILRNFSKLSYKLHIFKLHYLLFL